MKSFKSLALGLSLVAAIATVAKPQKAEAGVILMGTSMLASAAIASGSGDTKDILIGSLKVGGAFMVATVAIGGIIALGDNANPGETFKFAVLLDADAKQSDVEGVMMSKYPFLDDAASVQRLSNAILNKVVSLDQVNHVRLSSSEVAQALASANLSRAEFNQIASDLK